MLDKPSKKEKKIEIFNTIAKYSIYFLIGLLPIFFIPTSLIDIGQAKVGLLLLVVVVASISLGLSAIYSGGVKLISKKVLIPIISISFLTFISSILSTSYKDGLLGLGNELDSWFLTSIFLFTMILVASVVNTKKRIITALSLFWISFGVASLFQLFRLLAVAFKMEAISVLLSFGGIFNLSALNTIGTWTDFGIVAGVSVLSLALTLDLFLLKKSIRNTAWVMFVVSTIMAFVASSIVIGSGIDQLTNGSQFVVPSMSMVGLIALLFAIFQLAKRIQEQKKGQVIKIKDDKDSESSASFSAKSSVVKFPIASIVLIFLGIITLASPLAINQKINSLIGVPNESVLNIRPGFSDTYEVSKSVIGSSVKNSLFGIGTHGFYMAWNEYRPAYINKLESWNTDYQFGVGYLPTNIINNGILGFLLWIVSLMTLFVIGVVSIVRSKEKGSSSDHIHIIVFFTALFLWINAIINISGSMVVILTFIVTGLLLSNLVLNKKIITKNVSFEGVFKNKILFRGVSKNKVFAFVIALLVIILASLAVLWAERVRSQVYSIEAMHIIYAKDADISKAQGAVDLLQKAFNIYPADVYARNINNLILAQVNYDIFFNPANQQLAQDLKTGKQITPPASTSMYLKTALGFAKKSVDKNPNDFRNLLQLGSTLQTVALINSDQDAAKLALQSLLRATDLAPNHPLPLYSLASLYALSGDNETAKIILERTLEIKPNFVEASDMYQNILDSISSSVKSADAVKSADTIKSADSTNIKK